MDCNFKILEDKKLSIDEFITDIQKEKWDYYYYQHDIENTNHEAKFLLGKGLFSFDSIEFDTEYGWAINLYRGDDRDGHFLSIGGDSDRKDNQITYIHKKKMLNTMFNLTGTSYTVYFANMDKRIIFGALKIEET